MALIGPSGSGKTYSGLLLATELAKLLGNGRVAVIDTEHGSAAKYAPPSSRASAPQPGEFVFDAIELGNFDPRNYIEMIQAAEAERYDALVIDSLSHAWIGKGGALEQVDKAAQRSKSKNSFTAWRDVTPLHNALVEAIIGSSCHIFATMRSKTDYAMETDPNTGKLVPRKIGTAPIQREGMDYEFDIVADMDVDHNLIVGKTRCNALDGFIANRPGAALARTIAGWLSDGTPMATQSARHASDTPTVLVGQPLQSDVYDRSSLDQQQQIERLINQLSLTEYQVRSALARRGVSRIDQLNRIDAEEIIRKLEFEISRLQFIDTFPDPVTTSSTSESPSTGETATESAATDSDSGESESDAAASDFVVSETVRPIRGETATSSTTH